MKNFLCFFLLLPSLLGAANHDVFTFGNSSGQSLTVLYANTYDDAGFLQQVGINQSVANGSAAQWSSYNGRAMGGSGEQTYADEFGQPHTQTITHLGDSAGGVTYVFHVRMADGSECDTSGFGPRYGFVWTWVGNSSWQQIEINPQNMDVDQFCVCTTNVTLTCPPADPTRYELIFYKPTSPTEFVEDGLSEPNLTTPVSHEFTDIQCPLAPLCFFILNDTTTGIIYTNAVGYGTSTNGVTSTNQVPFGGTNSQPDNVGDTNPPPNVSTNQSGTGGGYFYNAGSGSGSGSGTNFYDIKLTNIATENTLRGMSNILSRMGGTNGASEKTLRGASNTLSGISNLLSATLTNFAKPQNWDAAVAALMSRTNKAAAEAAATDALGDYGVDGLLTGLNGTAMPAETVGAPDMTMQFCGQTIDLNPVNMFPNVASFSLLGFKIILVLAFLVEVSRMFWQLVAAESAAQTGGVPNMDFLGTNILGVAVAIAVPFVIIALFVVVTGYLFSHLGVTVASALQFNAFQNGMGSIGYYLLSSFFPVSLFFTLIVARITLQFTIAKLFALASWAARFVPSR